MKNLVPSTLASLLLAGLPIDASAKKVINNFYTADELLSPRALSPGRRHTPGGELRTSLQHEAGTGQHTPIAPDRTDRPSPHE